MLVNADGNKGLVINDADTSISLKTIHTITSSALTSRNLLISYLSKLNGAPLGVAAERLLGFGAALPSIMEISGHVFSKEYDVALDSTLNLVASFAGAKYGSYLGAYLASKTPYPSLKLFSTIGCTVGGAILGGYVYEYVKNHVEPKYRLDLDTPLHEVADVVAVQVTEIYKTIVDAQYIAKQDYGLPPSLQSESHTGFKGAPATTRGLITTEDVILLAHNLKILWIKQGNLPGPLAEIVKEVNSILEINSRISMPPTMYEFKLKSAVEKCVQESIVEFKSLVEIIEKKDFNDSQYDSINYENNDGPEAYTTPDDYQINIFKENVSGQEYYINDINTAQTSDTTWMYFLTKEELAHLQTADAGGLSGPSRDTFAELRQVAEARMAEQTANLDKSQGDANVVDPVVDGALNLPEGWEQADYAQIQAVLAAQQDGDASAAAEQANQQYQEYNSSMVSAGNSAYGIYNATLSGEGLALAQNTVNLITSIDQAIDSYIRLEGGSGGFLSKEMGQELGKVGAGLNFAGDLIELTESIGSGDALEVLGDAINLANSGLNLATSLGAEGLAEMMPTGLPVNPVGVVGSALQLMQGDTFGAIQSTVMNAISTGLMATGPYGWVAALGLQGVNMLMSSLIEASPPQAKVNFTIDADGNVSFSVGGDDALREYGSQIGGALVSTVQALQDAGVRLDIGGIPRISIIGDIISVDSASFNDSSLRIRNNCAPEELPRFYRDIALGRDAYDKVLTALQASAIGGLSLRELFGARAGFVDGSKIDLAELDRILAGYGITRDGAEFSWGGWTRPSEMVWDTVGTGQLSGGGNVSGERGQVVIQAADVKAVPLKPTPTPAMEVKTITQAIDLGSNFTGAAAGIMAVALGAGGLAAAASLVPGLGDGTANAAEPVALDSDDDLDSEELLLLVQGMAEQLGIASDQLAMEGFDPPDWSDPAEVEAFMAEHGVDRADLTAHLQSISDEFFAGEAGDGLPTYGDDLFSLLATAYTQSQEDGWDPDSVFSDGGSSGGGASGGSGSDGAQAGEGEDAYVNAAPRAGSDMLAATEDYIALIDPALLLANDSDVDGDRLVIKSVGNAENGEVVLLPDGQIQFTPDANFHGTAAFDYAVSDGINPWVVSRAYIEFASVNDAPQVSSELLAGIEDIIALMGPELLLANDLDIESDPLFIESVGSAEHGTVSLLADGQIQFTPDANFYGMAAFEYVVSDGLDTSLAKAFIAVEAVNDAPVAGSYSVTNIMEDDADVVLDNTVLFTNDYDVEGQALTVTSVQGAQHGNLSIDAAGLIHYKPDANYHGTDSFTYTITDADGAESVLPGQVELTINSVNDNPVAQYDAGAGIATVNNAYNISTLLANDFDVDGDSLSLDRITGTSGGSAWISGGKLYFKANSAGNYSVDYRITDGQGGYADSRLNLSIAPKPNEAPSFVSATNWGTYIKVTATDPDDSAGSLRYQFLDYESNRLVMTTYSYTDMDGFEHSVNEYVRWQTTLLQSSSGSFSFMSSASTVHGSLFGYVAPAWVKFQVTDPHGAGAIQVFTFAMSAYHHSPVILDLDGDGVEMLSVAVGVSFDWNSDGFMAETTGWMGADDAFLVYDHDHDQLITQADEISFVEYQPGATTDLEGLAAFDSNGDGLFSTADEKWAEFGVWQDADSDGVTDEGEFRTLDEAGITAIELTSDGAQYEDQGNTVHGTTTFHKADGTTGQAGDVALLVEEDHIVIDEPINAAPTTTGEQGVGGEAVAADTVDTASTPEGEAAALVDSADGGEVLTDAEIARLALQLQQDSAADYDSCDDAPLVSIPLEEMAMADTDGQLPDDYQTPSDLAIG